MFDFESIASREIANGLMFIMALATIWVFVHYTIRKCKQVENCFADVGIQGAITIVILLSGHAIQRFSGWMQFWYLHAGWDPGFWSNSTEMFMMATVLIVFGKELMVFSFSPKTIRVCYTVTSLVLALVVSIGLAIVTELWLR